ncbi:TPA: restriction endonuclease subunit S [Acinetobacter nosocomialis]|uniref:Type I restriction endonuclease subunit S n=1 Tax=Acinetobacter nosocomialis TaxID=106654 RepID=A0AB36M3Y8_ACINO|nr:MULTISPECIES: restriction endonuclease subunit S [Acinetobacter calcoaceticus/baumannii complex]EKW4080773.1 restriction endonuclease subunit S [Acinetobacter baumannii]EXB70223.1 type I restriction modification DNA specificity domain protein [Acinetobacter sp. 21871]EXR64421.1 type I restriction modification DNA specificity domain protein [Acinetobacter sp. 1424608]MBJ8460936.1 restriction endonuclease subunit S [Acinetobacter nosocomialis]OTK69280.1 type I restriction endonuclease subunit
MAAPKLRFKNAEGAEFTSWVTSFIGDECKITTGNKDTQNKIDGGKYPFFVRSQTVERINTYSKDCEAILTSGDGVGVGKNYHYINGKFDFHQRVYCLYDFSNQLLGKYLYIYFSNYFFDRVKRLSAKNSVDSVRMDMISKMEIKLPSLVEQTKIASFLSAVDEKISQLTQKHELLSQYKQGMMQKLFSQQIRFKADDGSDFGEWEEKKLSEISIKIKDGTHFSPKTFEVGEYKYLTSKNVKDGYLDFSNLEYVTKEEHLKIYSSCDVKYGDVLLTKDGTIGQCCVNTLHEEFSLLSSVAFLRLKPEYNNYFLYHLLVSDLGQKEISSAIAGQALKRITLTKINDFSFCFPCLAEQTKIANFLSSIDQKIEVMSQQIEQAKQWKKGLLQQMFV